MEPLPPASHGLVLAPAVSEQAASWLGPQCADGDLEASGGGGAAVRGSVLPKVLR